MSYWKSCSNCGCDLDRPSLREQFAELQTCPRCMHDNATEIPLSDALIELLERVENMESTVEGDA